jgi:hypothetical protein
MGTPCGKIETGKWKLENRNWKIENRKSTGQPGFLIASWLQGLASPPDN